MAHYGMGLVRLSKKQYSAAKDSFRRSLELRPDFQPAKSKLDKLNQLLSNVSETQ